MEKNCIIGATVMIGGTSKGTGVTDIKWAIYIGSPVWGFSFIYFCGDD